MKIVNIEPIFACICDVAPVPLPLGVGSIIVAQSQMDRRPLGICCCVQFFLPVRVLKFLISTKGTIRSRFSEEVKWKSFLIQILLKIN